MRNMRWVHVVLNYRYMLIIKIVANIYLALKICRLKKFWESHQLFWACPGRGLIYLSIIKGNTVVNHCACAFFLAVRARFSHMSNQQDSWCFFCFPMTFWLMGEGGGKGKIDPLTHNQHLSAVFSSLGWKSHVVIYWPWFRISSFAGICFWEIYKTSQSLVLW